MTKGLAITLLDQEITALEYSLNALYENKIKHDSDMQIDFIHQNLQEYLRAAAAEKKAAQYDLIYSFGLFDYFEKAVAKVIIHSLLPLLKPGGKLMIANISLENNHYRSFMEFGMDWFVVYRSREELAALAADLKPKYNVETDEIEEGTMKFLIITAV